MTTLGAPMGLQDGSLLLDCLGIRPRGRPGRGPRALTLPVSAAVVRQAEDNGITPLLYHRLTTVSEAPELPAAALDHLRDVALRSAARSLEIGRELSEILGALRRHGLAVVVLKGAHLGHLVYPSAALRTMGDLDLMVHREDLLPAERILTRLGYAPLHAPHELVDYAQHHHSRPLGKPGAVRVDLHWTIARPTAPFDVDLDGLWTRAVPARIAGVDALVLSPEDLLLHLCLHASFDHQFRLGLRACWDVAEVVRRYRDAIDWDVLGRRAERWRIGRYVHVTLRLVHELLAVDIPSGVLGRLEPAGFTPKVIAWARTGLFACESDASVSPALVELWTSRRLQAKLGVLVRTMSPPRAAMARIYGASLTSWRIYLYYPVRWVDLLVRYGRQAWGLWRGDHRTHDELRAVSERAALGQWLGRAEG